MLDSDSRDFVPLQQLRQRDAQPPIDPQLVASLGRHLDAFGENLTAAERTALSAMLGKARAQPDPVRAALAALAAQPAAAVMKPEEVATLDRLLAEPAPAGHGLHSSLVLVMKATRRCNLRCTYCHFWSDEPNQVMSFEVLARTTRSALEAPGVEHVEFVWHGGETTLLPLTFYRKALWLQERFRRPGQTLVNALQTNGTHLTAEWLDFIQRYAIKVGVSLDGPPEIHDRRRFDVAGRPTSERVREGIGKLRAIGLDPGILMVVDDDVIALGAERLLAYLLEIGVRKVALLNVIPENDPQNPPPPGSFLAFPRFVEFLRDLFRAWWPAHAEAIAFREISDLFGKVQGETGKICIFDGNCMGRYLTVEPRGDIAACDKYLGDPAYHFGNVLENGLPGLLSAPVFQQAHTVTAGGIELASRCPWFEVCQGGCPHDRHVRVSRGMAGDESCCGLAPLLDDIAQATGKSFSRSSLSK